MPPILTPLPRRLSSTHSPSPASSVDAVASLLNPSHIQRKLRNAPLLVEVDYVKPTISAADRMGTAFADSPAIAVNFEAGDMEDWCSPLDELLSIWSQPSSESSPVTYYRPGAPVPSSVPMMYTSSASSISTFSTASPLSASPLELPQDCPVDKLNRRTQSRRSRGASLEPIACPYVRPAPPRRLASLPYAQPPPLRRRSYTQVPPSNQPPNALEPLIEFEFPTRGRSPSCSIPGDVLCPRAATADLVDTLLNMDIGS